MPLKTISVSDFPHDRPSWKQQRQMQKVSDNFATLANLVATVGDSGGLVAGVGSSSARYAMGTTADKSMLKFYGDALNTTGYARILDARLYFGGVGGEGEAVRAYGIVNNVQAAVGGTVNGIHASLSITGASGQISGAGHAARATLELGASVNPGGTIDVMQLDSSIAADATIPASAAFLSISNIGSGKLPYLMRITSPDTTDMFVAAGTGAGAAGAAGGAVATHVLKISVGGTDYWIPLCNTNAS